LKIPNTKRAGDVAQGVGPEFKPQYCKKTKKKKKKKKKNQAILPKNPALWILLWKPEI
jgi:hypothetical protein